MSALSTFQSKHILCRNENYAAQIYPHLRSFAISLKYVCLYIEYLKRQLSINVGKDHKRVALIPNVCAFMSVFLKRLDFKHPTQMSKIKLVQTSSSKLMVQVPTESVTPTMLSPPFHPLYLV